MKRATMIFLILLMGACGERSRLEQRQAGGYQFFSRDSASVAQRARFAAAPAALEAVTVTKAVDLPPIGPSDVTNMVIRTGTAAIEVDSLEPAIAAVRALAIRVGGFVAGTDLETGRQAVPTATLELTLRRYGSAVDAVARDYANRVWDPDLDHSWASGYAWFADGNEKGVASLP